MHAPVSLIAPVFALVFAPLLLGLINRTKAFVAGRRFEFVTSSGNRINHRSLDLQIIWDDVIGIAKPSDEICSNERLRWWACLITGISDLGQLLLGTGRGALHPQLCRCGRGLPGSPERLVLAEWRAAQFLALFAVGKLACLARRPGSGGCISWATANRWRWRRTCARPCN